MLKKIYLKLVLIVLFAYAVIITYEYLKLRLKPEGVKSTKDTILLTDTLLVRETEVKEKVVFKPIEIHKIDTVYKIDTVLIFSDDTAIGVFAWNFRDFIISYDTLFLYKEDSLFRAVLMKRYQLFNPLKIKLVIDEKKPEKFYYNFYQPQWSSDFIEFEVVYKSIYPRVYLGGGLIYTDGINPVLSLGLVYRRFGFWAIAGYRTIGIGAQYRVK
ncbi:MAG: hypothetical protein QW228_05590 [Candidatus Aenigmatarchaeota archaeon]